jgi:uncharacterized cupin superfamily protein
MTQRRHPHVVHLDEVDSISRSHGERFAFRSKWLGLASGAKGVGCSWYEIPPGKTAFPTHFHCANEESVYILEGEGSLRLGKETIALHEGDYATFPTGPEWPHQLVNTGKAPLRYLCFSTLLPADVVGYPDSKKIGAAMWSREGGKPTPLVRGIFLESSNVDYYEGEK